jgi:hypothetical protein
MFHGDLPATTQMSFLHLLSSIFGSANLVVTGLNDGLDFIGKMLTHASINFFLHGKRRISSKKSAEPHEVSEVFTWGPPHEDSRKLKF